MARLAAQEKGEFYPTPLEIAEGIANLVHVQPVKGKPVLRLFDPCAGDGVALARVADVLRTRNPDLPVETWGVEINARRAAEAAARLDHVVASPFEVAAWKPSRWGIASILVLNAPYDFSASSSYTRMETMFLERATPALEPGGLLVIGFQEELPTVGMEYFSELGRGVYRLWPAAETAGPAREPIPTGSGNEVLV